MSASDYESVRLSRKLNPRLCPSPPPIWSLKRRWEDDRGGEDARSDLEASITSEIVIAFKNVSISFDGRPVLEDMSFTVGRTQTLCILGRSGVGKSVALRLLMGFLKPDSGTIRG